MSDTQSRQKICGREFGQLMCKALGFPVERVAGLHLHVTPGEAVSVDIKRFVSVGEAERMYAMLEKYELVNANDVENHE